MLAPGDSLSVGGEGVRLTALWRSGRHDTIYLVTCGHVFHGGAREVWLPHHPRPIGVLTVNLLPVVDVALVEFTGECALDLDQVDQGLSPAGGIRRCHWVRDGMFLETTIEQYPHINRHQPGRRAFIKTSLRGEAMADSGAPLMAGGRLLGLLTGVDTAEAYYTPLSGITAELTEYL